MMTSCKDKETAFMEKRISIMEDVDDKDSADSAAEDLMDLDLEEEKYKRENFSTKVQMSELMEKMEKANFYNSEHLRKTLLEMRW